MITVKDIESKLMKSPSHGENIVMGYWRLQRDTLYCDSCHITTANYLPSCVIGFYCSEQPKISESALKLLSHDLTSYDAANYLLKYYNEQTKSSVVIRDLLGD